MIGANINSLKSNFFDRQSVLRAVAPADHRVLSKFGAFVRRRARSSIRQRKRVSRAGEPPSSHTGKLKRFIFFAYEPERHNVVIGPAKLNGTRSGTALEALEKGGQTVILTRRARGEQQLKRTVTIAARPFMQPAFKKELPGVARLYRDQIHS